MSLQFYLFSVKLGRLFSTQVDAYINIISSTYYLWAQHLPKLCAFLWLNTLRSSSDNSIHQLKCCLFAWRSLPAVWLCREFFLWKSIYSLFCLRLQNCSLRFQYSFSNISRCIIRSALCNNFSCISTCLHHAIICRDSFRNWIWNSLSLFRKGKKKCTRWSSKFSLSLQI